MPYSTLYYLGILLVFGSSITQLGSEDYVTREAAELRLSTWADLCWPLLTSCNTKNLDLEQLRRLQRVKSSVIPTSLPHISFLGDSKHNLLEWQDISSTSVYNIIGPRPGPTWHLVWVLPDPKEQQPYQWIIRHYGEKAKSQYKWRDWHSDRDGRLATLLMLEDMQRLGMHPTAMRYVLCRMMDRECVVYLYPPEKIGVGR